VFGCRIALQAKVVFGNGLMMAAKQALHQ